MALDTDQQHPGYLCGRLFAVLQALEVAALPDGQRALYYGEYSKVVANPGLAIRLTATRSPAWLTKLAHHDPAAAETHKARIADLLDLIPTPDFGVGEENSSWAILGHSHQESADISAGLRPDHDHLITTAEVAEMLHYNGDNSIKSAASWLHRHGIKPAGRRPGRTGQNQYSYATVKAAQEAMPGQGARTDIAQ